MVPDRRRLNSEHGGAETGRNHRRKKVARRRETASSGSSSNTSRLDPQPKDYISELEGEIRRLNELKDHQAPLIERLLSRNEALQEELRALRDVHEYRRSSMQEYLESTAPMLLARADLMDPNIGVGRDPSVAEAFSSFVGFGTANEGRVPGLPMGESTTSEP